MIDKLHSVRENHMTKPLLTIPLFLLLVTFAACSNPLTTSAEPPTECVPKPLVTPRPHVNAPQQSVYYDIDLPSASAGEPDGVLALRILAPASNQEARYTEGAPVVVIVPGGDTPGSLRPQLIEAQDMIRILFLFPGGQDPVAGRRSDGRYDHRGEQSIAALADVIRYAAGALADAQGRTIDELLPVTPLHDNIGLLGASNGGNIVVAVAALYGEELAGHLRYLVQWESPVSSQVATVDLGGVFLDCERHERLDVVNPRYRGYGALSLDVDYSQLAYNPSDPRHPIFLDGNGDGRYTTVLDPSTGCRTPDLDGDGVLTIMEDWPLSSYTDGVKTYYSRPVVQAMAAKHLFNDNWPQSIATLTEAERFWDIREGVRLMDDAVNAIPDIEGMILATFKDHVQSAPDKPHIRQAFERWDQAGAWVQINPSPSYLIQADQALSGRTDLPQNVPNTPPVDWNAPAAYTVPEDIGLETLFAAAVWQMADRIQQDATSPGTPTPSQKNVFFPWIMLHFRPAASLPAVTTESTGNRGLIYTPMWDALPLP